MLGYTDGVVGTGMLRSIRLGNANAANAESKADPVDEIIRANDVVVFQTATCPYCKQARDALNAAGIAHTVIDVEQQQRQDLLERTGKSSVPSVWVKGTYIGGCNDGPEDWMGVNPCLQSGKLKELLNA